MRTDELYLETRILVTILAKTALRALEQRLNAIDASVSGLQFGIMQALSFEEQTISELSQSFMLDPSTFVPAVDALERKGFVKRGTDPSDRRRIPLSLTKRGVQFVAEIPLVDPEDPVVISLDTLGGDSSYQLLTLLRELVRNLPDGEEILRTVSFRVQSQMAREPVGVASTGVTPEHSQAMKE